MESWSFQLHKIWRELRRLRDNCQMYSQMKRSLHRILHCGRKVRKESPAGSQSGGLEGLDGILSVVPWPVMSYLAQWTYMLEELI